VRREKRGGTLFFAMGYGPDEKGTQNKKLRKELRQSPQRKRGEKRLKEGVKRKKVKTLSKSKNREGDISSHTDQEAGRVFFQPWRTSNENKVQIDQTRSTPTFGFR